MNWSWGKCGTGQGDSSKGAGASGWKTPTGVEFARSPVFNTTSSSLPAKQIRLRAVLWRLEMSAIVSLRVGVCSWIESGTTLSWSVRGYVDCVALHTEQSRAGDVRYVRRQYPRLTSFPPAGIYVGKVSGGGGPSGCESAHVPVITTLYHRRFTWSETSDWAEQHARTCKNKHVYVLCAEKCSNWSSGVNV